MSTTFIHLAELYDELYGLLEAALGRGDKEESLRLLGRIRAINRGHKDRLVTVMGLRTFAADPGNGHDKPKPRLPDHDRDGRA